MIVPRAVLRPAAVLAAALLVVLVFLRLGAPEVAPGAAAQSALDWRGCGGAFECATLQVPLDHTNPASRQIGLALIRRPARDPARRIGSLLVNPGGPGGSGVEFARGAASAFPAEIQQRFDIVGFDPRGVGASTPLLCHDRIQELAGSDPEPVTDDQWAEVARRSREFAQLCAERGGDLIPHLGSLDVARDMERIRQALGDERLTYLGFSYGTLLGELYADRFPDRVRALVLDGPIDPGISPDDATAVQAVGFERALDAFIADCRARSCAIAADGADPWAAIDAIVERARSRPIPSASADRPAGPGEVLLGVFQALYRPGTWRVLERAVIEARAGDGSIFIRLTDSYLGRRGNDYANELEMNAAVNCLDYAFSRDVDHYRGFSDRMAALAPRLGRAVAPGGVTCAFWGAAARPVALTGGAAKAPPLLVVGTTNDPATPFEWALGARRALPSAVLLTHEGEGHTVYLSGKRCVEDVVNRYLLELATPEDGAICGPGDDTPRTPPAPPAQRVSPSAAQAPAPPPQQGTPVASATAAFSPSAAPLTPPAGQAAQTATASPTTSSASEAEGGAEASISLRLLAGVVLVALVVAMVWASRRLTRR